MAVGSRPALGAWLRSGFLVSILVGQVLWAYVVWFNVADPFGRDALVLLLYMMCLFGVAGAGIAAAGWLAGRLLPRLTAIFTPASAVVAAWFGYVCVARILVKGVYYSAWGIESRQAAMAIYVLLYGAAALASLGIASAVVRLEKRVFVIPAHRRRVLGAVLVGFPILVGLVGVVGWKLPPEVDRGASVSSDPGRPLAILAFDGMTWSVLGELIDQGRVPNFQRLKEGGSFATLETLPIGNSPEIWNTVATGTDPRVHGVNGHVSFRLRLMEQRYFFPHYMGFNFFLSRPLAYLGLMERQPPTSLDRRAPAFWNIASEEGKPTIVINWFGSWPAEEILGIDATSGLFSTLEPDDTGDPGAGVLVPVDAARAEASAESYVWPREFLADAIAVRERARSQRAFHLGLAESALRRVPAWHIFAIYSSQPDGVQHRYWDTREPAKYYLDAAEREAARANDVIAETYVELDGHLGKLLGLLREGTTVMVVSDHGAESVFARFGEPGGHSTGPPGVLILSGPGIRKGHELSRAHVRDLMPTISYIAGLRIARDWEGRVLEEAFEDGSRRTPTYVDSYGLRSLETRALGARQDEDSREKRMEELRALGYIR